MVLEPGVVLEDVSLVKGIFGVDLALDGNVGVDSL